jgi:glucose-1-phosphate cytidylyltransferase
MKVVILAGGYGTRLSEETNLIPKPLVEIGGKPILWHIMNIYASHGINDFVICCGYKGNLIKEYFANYFLNQSDVTFNLSDNSIKVHQNNSEPWSVTLVDTGTNTMTGGRLKRISQYVKYEETFCFTYGDGLGDINISALIKFHKNHGKEATVTATRPPGRYGALKFGSKNIVESFQEKPDGDGSWINGGFFVLNSSVINLIKDDHTIWEQEPLDKLTKKNQLGVFKHDGFWQPMDTLREKIFLNKLWDEGNAPWKIWK